MKFRFGADPEVFLAAQDGSLKASCGRIGGSKVKPMPMGAGPGFFILEDNVAVEFNIPPAESSDELAAHMQRALKEITDGVKSMYNFEVVNLSAASFPEEELQTEAAQVFGCDPDFNAWTGKKNPRPNVEDKNLRSCGGHIHIGVPQPDLFVPRTVIKMCDLYLGVPSVLMDEKGDKRRPLYGKGGAFRPKPYGVEYRTLSNFWIFDKRTIDWAFRSVDKALEAVVAQSVDVDSEQEAILDAINNNNKARAEELVHKYNLEVVYV
jgi:hypothetical protein